jgi:hypothetical protein
VAAASSLQLALDLLKFCHVTCGERDFSVGDYKKHVNECVSGNVVQLSEHRVPSCSELKIIAGNRNPTARREGYKWMKIAVFTEPDWGRDA